jgi:hypothetical protein
MFSKHFSLDAISLSGGVQWPARLPDVNTYNCFFSGPLKSKVYAGSPRSITELKQNMRDEMAEILLKMLQIMGSFWS